MICFESARNWGKRVAPGFVRRGVWRYREFRQQCRSVVRLWHAKIQVGDEPWLDDESKAIFLSMLVNSRSYLEYGSGGSTVLAARLNKPFVCVETNRRFLAAVRRKIGKAGPNQHLLHGNIGWTQEYGEPIFKTPRADRRKRWKTYAEMPWRYVARELQPDLVMVDGRFRVAAALTSCVHLVSAPESSIVVDDYVMRDYYHVLEQHARLVKIAGRMAIFQPPPTCSPAILEAIDQYALDWR